MKERRSMGQGSQGRGARGDGHRARIFESKNQDRRASRRIGRWWKMLEESEDGGRCSKNRETVEDRGRTGRRWKRKSPAFLPWQFSQPRSGIGRKDPVEITPAQAAPLTTSKY